MKEYTKPDGSDYNLYTDGLKIYTTIDSRLQHFAEKAAEAEMRRIQANYFKQAKKDKLTKSYGSNDLLNQQVKQADRARTMRDRKASKEEVAKAMKTPVKMTILNWKTGLDIDTMLSPIDSVKYYLSLLNTGFLAVDYKTGKILAWVGGVNFKYAKFDHIKSRRQVGSTFKPVLYSQALESGIDPCKHWHNEHITYEEFDNWAPKNVDEQYGGYYNMEGAMRRSINTIAVQVILETEAEPVVEMAKRMGINSPIPKEAGIALGGVDLTLYEMVQRLFDHRQPGQSAHPSSCYQGDQGGRNPSRLCFAQAKILCRSCPKVHADMVRFSPHPGHRGQRWNGAPTAQAILRKRTRSRKNRHFQRQP
ncbi:MAG: hypothetical protein IPM82_27780 [Saprospiraceae bacterium]|nr:hypothetical protein [Saprospiraceae bacterium]